MTLRAKFQVFSVTKYADGGESIGAIAVNGPANAQWSTQAPSGSLKMLINNEAAHGILLPGKFYFLDFSEVDEDAI